MIDGFITLTYLIKSSTDSVYSISSGSQELVSATESQMELWGTTKLISTAGTIIS